MGVEWVLSFHHVDPGDWSQAISLGGKHLYSLSRLACPTHHTFERKYIIE